MRRMVPSSSLSGSRVMVFITNLGPTAGLSHFVLKGHVFPDTAKATLRVPGTQWILPEHNIDITYTLQLTEGNLAVNCYAKNYSEKISFPMLMRAHDFAQAAIDTLAFTTGWGLTFIFETITLPNGTIEVIAIQEKVFAELSTAVHPQSGDFDTVVNMVLVEPPLFRAMHDLIQSITVVHAAQTACLRAVETLRNYMVPTISDRKKQWKIFGDALRIEESYLKPVRDLSTGPRHGDPIHIPGSETKDAQKRVWIVMNRYLEFRRLGGKDLLPLDRFPLLT